MTIMVRVKLPLHLNTTRNKYRRSKWFCLSKVSSLHWYCHAHVHCCAVSMDNLFTHFAHCSMSESTFTMNVFRFWRSRKYNSLWTFLCEPYSVQHYWQICLIFRQFPLYNINWIGFYSINLLKNLTYISKSQYGGDLALWLACLCTVNSSFILF